MKTSHFRYWFNEKWFQHKDEELAYAMTLSQLSASDYFALYKWWLKAEYQKEQAKHQHTAELRRKYG